MNRWRIVILFWIICSTICSVMSVAQARFSSSTPAVIYGKQNLIAQVNRSIQPNDNNADIGIQIKSMRSGDLIYSKNAQMLLAPASVVKILTAEAALLYLGPQYTFPTRLLTDAKRIRQGIVNGNVYLVHSGDPSLTYQDLTDLLVALKAQNIKQITGSVYIDNTAYDQSNFGLGWTWKDKQYCYGAPINASIINHNCLPFKITPGIAAGRKANFVPNPHYFYSGVANSVVTKQARARACSLQLSGLANSAISITGCMRKGHYIWGSSIVIQDIMGYNKSLMHWLFRRYGIQVNGDITSGSAPAGLSTIAVHQSQPLSVLVKEMLKKSDNIIAGSLFKKIGELYAKQPGSWRNGSESVKSILAQRANVDPSQMLLLDGSGLSHENRVKPAQIMQVLNFAYHNASTNINFINSLPIAGIDGTLKHRLYNVARRVRAKTGTTAESGVVSLAGYVINKDKEPLAFVIIANGKHSGIWKYRKMEDQIVTALANYKS